MVTASPRAAIDGEALKALSRRRLRGGITDRIEEMTMTRPATDPVQREYLAAWNAAGVTCIVQNAGEEAVAQRLLKRLALHLHHRLPAWHRVASGFPTISSARREPGRTASISPATACLWRSGSLREENPLCASSSNWIRMMHLTYNRRNMMAVRRASQRRAQRLRGTPSSPRRTAWRDRVVPGWQTSLARPRHLACRWYSSGVAR